VVFSLFSIAPAAAAFVSASFTSTAHCHQPVSAYGASGVVSLSLSAAAAVAPPVLAAAALDVPLGSTAIVAATITSTAHCHQPVSAYGASGVVSIPSAAPAPGAVAPAQVLDAAFLKCRCHSKVDAAFADEALHFLKNMALQRRSLEAAWKAENDSLMVAAFASPVLTAAALDVPLESAAIVPAAITSTAHCHQPVSAYGASGVVSLPAAAAVAPPVLVSAVAPPAAVDASPHCHSRPPRPLWTRLADCMTGVRHSFDTLCAVTPADRKGKAKEHAKLALRGSLENLSNNYTIIHGELDEALIAMVPWPTDEELQHFQRLSDSIWGAVDAEENFRAAAGVDRGPLGTELRSAVQTLLDVWGEASTPDSTQNLLSRLFCGESREPYLFENEEEAAKIYDEHALKKFGVGKRD